MKDNMDIEALRFFLVLYEYKHLTLAAQQCDLSKSGASRLLARLRDHFHDELFRKCSNGMVATPRAQRLYGDVQKMMRLYSSLTKEEVFCPTKITKVFRIAGVDNSLVTFLAPAMKAMLKIATHMSIQFVPMVRSIEHALRSGEVDFVVYSMPTVEKDIKSITLATDTYVVIVDKQHPLIEKWCSGSLTMQDLINYRQVRITTDQQSDGESKWIMKIDNVPHEGSETAIWTPFFSTATQLISNTDFWGVVPAQLALKQYDRLKTFEILGRIPNAPSIHPKIYWHESTHHDPAYQWVRSMIIGKTQGLENIENIENIPIILEI